MRKIFKILVFLFFAFSFQLGAQENQESSFTIIDPLLKAAKIIPEDVLIVEYENSRAVLPVDKEGNIFLTEGEKLEVKGLNVDEVSRIIYQKTGKVNRVAIATLSSSVESCALPQGVSVLGEVNRPGLVQPGRLSSIIAQVMGPTSSFNGEITVFHRDQKYGINYQEILKGNYQKDIYCQPGDVVLFSKTSGSKIVEGISPILTTLRDIALVFIAVVEVNNAGQINNWW